MIFLDIDVDSYIYIYIVCIYGYGSKPIHTIFSGLFTSMNPSYFDVNYRGTRFSHTAIYINININININIYINYIYIYIYNYIYRGLVRFVGRHLLKRRP